MTNLKEILFKYHSNIVIDGVPIHLSNEWNAFQEFTKSETKLTSKS